MWCTTRLPPLCGLGTRKELIIASSREMVEASWWQGPMSENLDSVFLWQDVGRALPGP